MIEFLSINNTFISLLGYNVSWLELLGTLSGLWCVWWTAKAKWESYPIGIINIVLFFYLFYQIQLYSDMFLQILFLLVSFYGWYQWTHPKENEADKKDELKISYFTNKQRLYLILGSLAVWLLWTQFIINVPNIWPSVFPEPASYPYLDAFTTIGSVVAIVIQARKKMEGWFIWIFCDVIDAGLYFSKGTLFLGIEYIVFLIICIYGLYHWIKEYKSYETTPS